MYIQVGLIIEKLLKFFNYVAFMILLDELSLILYNFKKGFLLLVDSSSYTIQYFLLPPSVYKQKVLSLFLVKFLSYLTLFFTIIKAGGELMMGLHGYCRTIGS